jgi:hypothetical protein
MGTFLPPVQLAWIIDVRQAVWYGIDHLSRVDTGTSGTGGVGLPDLDTLAV